VVPHVRLYRTFVDEELVSAKARNSATVLNQEVLRFTLD
jgi:hypothetical protein